MKRFLALALAALMLGHAAGAQEAGLEEGLLRGEAMCSYRAGHPERAFDGEGDTYYQASQEKMQWVGLDLGAPHVITRIGFLPRNLSQGGDRMVLSLFEGANRPDFMDAVPLYLISYAPSRTEMTYVAVNVSRGFRYVRYVGGAGSYCSVAELEFYGHEGEGDDSHFYQITSLPTMSIHVADGAVPQKRGEDFESNSVLIYEGGTMIQEYPVLTRVRGNYSATPENKPYRVKFNDGKSHHMMKGSATNEAPVKAKKWVLLNSWRDKTLMRNPVAWNVSKRLEPVFTPWSQPVDLILNGDYRGTYVLADQVNASKGRIDITEMTESDIEGEALTGGYFFEADNNYGREAYHFLSSHGNTMSVHDPDEDVMQPEQFNYIRDYFNHMEDVLFSSNYRDPSAGYQSVLDLESFLKYFLISEFNGNTDMICQVFLYKERGDDHIYTGPVWDHELALDDDETVYPGNLRDDWTYKVRQTGNYGAVVSRVLSDANAMARLQALWADARDAGRFDPEAMTQMVDSFRNDMRESARLNFLRWPYLNQYISLTPAIRGTWDAEVDVVRDYVTGRVAWMDRKLNYNTLAKEGDYYQLFTPRDLFKFMELVNSGEWSASAQLMADLDMTNYSGKMVPLGTAASPYTGTIEGNGHVIDNLRMEGRDAVALVAYGGGSCTIRNLTMGPGCVFRGETNVAAFVASSRSGSITLTRVGNEGRVEASGVGAAGLVGSLRKLAICRMTDCYNTGAVSANNMAAALISQPSGKIYLTNCYNSGTIQGAEAGSEFANSPLETHLTNCFDATGHQAEVTRVSAAEVEDGTLCFRLNEVGDLKPWRQNLNNGSPRDLHPVLQSTHGNVYEEDGHYTNVRYVKGAYTYYLWQVTAIQGGSGVLQLAEFDLLDSNNKEIDDMAIYAGTESSIGHENWPNVADNSVWTKYCSGFFGSASFFFKTPGETEIYGYRIYTANDTQDFPDRNPVSWKLYGSETYSDDPSDPCWVLLDEQADCHVLGATNYTPYDFLLARCLDGVALDRHTVYLVPGGQATLTATLTPSSYEGTPLQWTSTDTDVVSVDGNGQLTAHALGQAKVVVSAVQYAGIADTCQVVVVDPEAGFQYYLFELMAARSGSTVQLSEFDIIGADGEEVPNLHAYATRGAHFSNQEHEKLFDDDTSTKYCGTILGDPSLTFFEAEGVVLPTAYRMYTANDTRSFSGRNPMSWRLWAGNEKSSDPKAASWLLLDEQIGNTTIGSVNLTPFTFPIDPSLLTPVERLPAAEPLLLPADTRIYDLSGRPVRRTRRLPRGIYIMGGRKVVIR